MAYYKSIPHTTMQINFIGTAAVTLLPTFRGAILAPLKRVRHFYGQDGLSEFYAPSKSMSGLVDSNLSNYLVYGHDINESDLPAILDYPGFTGPQQDFFELQQDSVKLAGDKIKWLVDMSSLVEPYAGQEILPYITNMASPLSNLGMGTIDSTVIAAGASDTHEVGVPQTLLLTFTKAGGKITVFVDVSQLTTTPQNLRTGTGLRRDILGSSAALFGTTGVCNVSYDDVTGILTVALTAGDSGITAVTVMSLDQLTVVPFPDDPTVDGRWFYLTLNRVGAPANTNYSVLRGIQGYGDITAGTMVDDTDNNGHMFLKVTPSEDYTGVWVINTPGKVFTDIAEADYPDKVNVPYPFYSFLSTSIYNVTPTGTPGDKTLPVSALGSLLTESHSVTGDLIFVCDAHVSYIADFAGSDLGNRYINRVFRSNASATEFPIQDGAYAWGLPHPDNPMGFGASIVSTFLGSSDNYFYVVLSDDKATGFDLANAMIPQILFMANLWEEFGQGGVNEGGMLTTLATTRGDYPIVCTYVTMNPRIDKRGTADDYNPYTGICTTDDYYFYKHANDKNFTASPAVEVGDIIEVVYSDASTQRAVVTGVEAGRVRISKKCTQTATPEYTIYTRMTSPSAATYYNGRMTADNFNMFVNLNEGVQWGTHILSNKWYTAVIMAMRLVYPEQQPLTGIGVNIGLFGVPYGGYDFFRKTDLDTLVSNGYYIFVSDPESSTGYVVRDCTAGLKSDDWRRGNGNAAVPIATFAASCRTILDSLKGKYNKSSYTRNRVALGLQAVEAKYTATPPVPDYGPKLQRAKFTGMEPIAGGYRVVMSCVPMEQANIFELVINVEFAEGEV